MWRLSLFIIKITEDIIQGTLSEGAVNFFWQCAIGEELPCATGKIVIEATLIDADGYISDPVQDSFDALLYIDYDMRTKPGSQNMEPQPIACTLSEEALKERKSTTLEQLFGQAKEVQQLPAGYRFRFEASDQVLMSIMEMITKERKCCTFLDFRLDISAAEGPVWLSLEGPEGTREFIESVIQVDKTLINKSPLESYQ